MRNTNALSLKQSRVMPSDYTTYQLAHLYHISSEAIDQQKSIQVVFCDINKVVDKGLHTRLLAKWSRVGVTGGLLRLFENNLYNWQLSCDK